MLTARCTRSRPSLFCNFLRPALLAAAALLLVPALPPTQPACSEEKDASKSDEEQTKKERAARLEVMRRHAASLSVKVESGGSYSESAMIDVPLLHYNNPGGETLDATVWAWGRRGRPVALASISQERTDTGIEKWSCELVSLADKPVLLAARPRWNWAPATSGIEWLPVANAPPAGETPVVRARQMKGIARQYSATGFYRDGAEVVELRLMDRQLSRFSDSERGLVDGAFYAFAGGTNPEVLLIVECRTKAGGNAWYLGFARMGAGRLVARLGEKVVWERPEIKTWDPAEPYFSTYGPVDSVFGMDK